MAALQNLRAGYFISVAMFGITLVSTLILSWALGMALFFLGSPICLPLLCLVEWMGMWSTGLTGNGTYYDPNEVAYIPLLVWLIAGLVFGLLAGRFQVKYQFPLALAAIVVVTIGMNVVLAVLGLSVHIEFP
jgi:hypothetical protein